MNNEEAAPYKELQDKLASFARNEIGEPELKPHAAPLGIYQQRNGFFMARIRIPGGHLSVAQWKNIASTLDGHGASRIHLSTRQDIQVHDLPAAELVPLVLDSCENGLPFKGGGGNTVRNITASADSGLSSLDAFDVMPEVQRLTRIAMSWPKAYQLPRKLKICLAASSRDEETAALNDLGFVAITQNGVSGFTVYGGGGMGNASAFGVKLIDFIPLGDLTRAAWAMTELFYDHGDRENRKQARVRFVLAKLGEEKFVRLFLDYYERAPKDLDSFFEPTYDLQKELGGIKKYHDEKIADPEYEYWEKTAVAPTRFGDDIKSVLLRIPKGNLSAGQMKKIAELADICGVSFFRLTPEQDLLLPLVHQTALPRVYRYLNNELVEIDLILKSFVGHLTTCVGSSVCKIGILDSPKMGDAIAVKLDEHFKDKPQLKAELASRIIASIRISGCPNACSGHPAAMIGLQGEKRKLLAEPEPVYRFFVRASNQKFKMARPEMDCLRSDDAVEKVLHILIQKEQTSHRASV